MRNVRVSGRQAIRDYNWLDAKLFDHFNKSLWDRIAGYQAYDRMLAAQGTQVANGEFVGCRPPWIFFLCLCEN